MLLALLIYSYATGTFSSRRIEQSTFDSVPVRLLTADTHPDHDTLCTFRRENQAMLTGCFVKVWQLAQHLQVLQVGQITVAVDGTKILANASKHAAVSYERAGQRIEQLEMEVQQLVAKGWRSRRQPRCFQSVQDEPIFGTARPAGVLHRRDLLPLRRFPKPGLFLFAFFEVELLVLAGRGRGRGPADEPQRQRGDCQRQHSPESKRCR